MYRGGYEFTTFKPYTHRSKTEISFSGNKFSLTISAKASKVCDLGKRVTGSHYPDDDELLPDSASVYNLCESFVKRK